MTTLRPARPDDAAAVAALHADSWRRHYRGAYADAFLDGDLVADRLTVWSARLSDPAQLAVDSERLTGFVHVTPADDPRWGALVDNLHVAHDRHRAGIGRALLAAAAAETGPGSLAATIRRRSIREPVWCPDRAHPRTSPLRAECCGPATALLRSQGSPAGATI